MANILNIQPYGNQMMVLFDDGSRLMALPTGNGIFVVGGSKYTAPPPPPPPSGGGNPPVNGVYQVIFPTPVHNVSDSFQDHLNRGSVNPGTDYTASYGDPVYAVSSGLVTDADSSPGGGGGRTVHIDHDDGWGSDYLHLSTIQCAIGQHVNQGDLIAHSGASGGGSDYGYAPHLHISFRHNHSHGYINDGNIDFDAYVRSEGLS